MNFPERHHKTVNRTAVFHALMLSMCLSGIIYMYSWFFLHLYFGPKPTEKLFSRLFFGALYSSLGAGIIVFIKIYRHLKDVSGEDLKQPLNQISLEILQQQFKAANCLGLEMIAASFLLVGIELYKNSRNMPLEIWTQLDDSTLNRLKYILLLLSAAEYFFIRYLQKELLNRLLL